MQQILICAAQSPLKLFASHLCPCIFYLILFFDECVKRLQKGEIHTCTVNKSLLCQAPLQEPKDVQRWDLFEFLGSWKSTTGSVQDFRDAWGNPTGSFVSFFLASCNSEKCRKSQLPHGDWTKCTLNYVNKVGFLRSVFCGGWDGISSVTYSDFPWKKMCFISLEIRPSWDFTCAGNEINQILCVKGKKVGLNLLKLWYSIITRKIFSLVTLVLIIPLRNI